MKTFKQHLLEYGVLQTKYAKTKRVKKGQIEVNKNSIIFKGKNIGSIEFDYNADGFWIHGDAGTVTNFVSDIDELFKVLVKFDPRKHKKKNKTTNPPKWNGKTTPKKRKGQSNYSDPPDDWYDS